MKLLILSFLIVSSVRASAQEITVSGTMHRSSLEGGCWYLQGDGGKRFELVGDTGVVHPLRVEGQHVVVRAEMAKGEASTCMIGEIVRVLQRIDTVRYAIDLPVNPVTVDGIIHRTKSGVWFVKTTRGREYEFQKPPAKQYRHVGASIHQKFRVLMDKKSTRENMDGVILPESNHTMVKSRMKQKTYDAR
jgi:hypothetical protein